MDKTTIKATALSKQIKVLIILFLIAGVLISGFVKQKPDVSEQAELKKFSSQGELEEFLETNTESYGYYGTLGRAGIGTFATTTAESIGGQVAPTAKDAGAEEFSTTNIQVEGVDEPDIVKNDGKYIYTIAGNKVVIVDAYPAEDAEILSEIEFNGTPYQMFINGDKLVVFGRGYGYYNPIEAESTEASEAEIGVAKCYGARCYGYSYGTFIHVYDLSDRRNPVLERNASVSGNYFDSRMIGDYAYAIINQPVYYTRPGPVPLPIIDSGETRTVIPASEIYYFDVPDYSYIYTNIVAVNTQDADEEATSKTFLMGYSRNLYASINNIYIVYTKRLRMNDYYDRIIEKAILPVVPATVRSEINSIRNSDLDENKKFEKIGEIFQNYIESMDPETAAVFMQSVQKRTEAVMIEIAKEIEKTVVHKIAVDGSNIEYKTAGEVPGHVLNQFSMDEHNDYFRIATTTSTWRAESANHLYILNSNLEIVGKVEDLAPGERIYSTRFIGDKGYMVTFRQIDPLFVIDLSSPTNPQVLGFLKIPGVSDYLHPYDDTHIIGIGRDATEEGRMLGMKLSLFDISDFSNPTEMSKYMIGERGTSSEALNDHKAFLFDKGKNLLVIPITVREKNYRESWQGAYVFNLDLDNGFVLKGKVTHANETAIEEDDYKHYYDYNSKIRRSLYIDNVLYTISNKMIKMNDLDNIENEINKVELPTESDYYPYPIGIREVPIGETTTGII